MSEPVRDDSSVHGECFFVEKLAPIIVSRDINCPALLLPFFGFAHVLNLSILDSALLLYDAGFRGTKRDRSDDDS